jgi:hypothetical protein
MVVSTCQMQKDIFPFSFTNVFLYIYIYIYILVNQEFLKEKKSKEH